MKKYGFLAVFALAILLTTTSVRAQVIEAPSYTTGDWWVFSYTKQNSSIYSTETLPNGIYLAKYNEDCLTLYEYKNEKRGKKIGCASEFYKHNWLLLPYPRTDLPVFEFPLALGKERSNNNYYREGAQGGGAWFNGTVKIASETKDIDVRAGKLLTVEAVKRECGPYSCNTGTYYYSPTTKSIVKHSIEYESGTKVKMELIKYGANQSR